MRSMYGPEKLLLASKKPKIKELIANCYLLSTEEIQSLDEKPDIIRGLLAIKNQVESANALERAEKIADMMMAANQMK